MARKKPPVKRCSFEGCDRTLKGATYCTGHESQLRRGTPLRPLGNRGRSGSEHHAWRGDEIGYRGRHARLGRVTDHECVLGFEAEPRAQACHRQARMWALDWRVAKEENIRRESSGLFAGKAYSLGPDSDYILACFPCHARFDLRRPGRAA